MKWLVLYATILHCNAILSRRQPGRIRLILLWIMPFAQDRSLDLLASSPASYHWTTDEYHYINLVTMTHYCIIIWMALLHAQSALLSYNFLWCLWCLYAKYNFKVWSNPWGLWKKTTSLIPIINYLWGIWGVIEIWGYQYTRQEHLVFCVCTW